MSKPVIIMILVIIVIAVIALIILSVNYFNCLADEGQPCGASTARTSTASGITFKPPVSGSLKYTCNFFTGKTCQ